MSELVLPALCAVLLWWLTTGVLLYLDRLPRWTFPISLSAGTLVLIAALYGVSVSSADTGVSSAYIAFFCGVLVWGWLEMSFLMGFITGSRRYACGPRCTGWRHLGHAVEAIIYHELAIIMAAAMLLWLTYGQPNQFALWTFVALWAMRLSAKLNLFLGVPNLGEQLLPEHLKYLSAYFKRRAMNYLFPVSISLGVLACTLAIQHTLNAADAFNAAGFGLLSTLLILGVLEHWFLVLPLPTDALWKWSLRGAASELPPLRGYAVRSVTSVESRHD